MTPHSKQHRESNSQTFSQALTITTMSDSPYLCGLTTAVDRCRTAPRVITARRRTAPLMTAEFEPDGGHPCTRLNRIARRESNRAGTFCLVLVLLLALTACDAGGGSEDEPGALNPDDVQVVFQAFPGTSRDEMQATITSASTRLVDLVNLSLFFQDADGTQIGQMSIVFLGAYNRGDRAEQRLGLPAGVERHANYACYRYRIGLTGDGTPANKTYDGTCG